MHTLAMPTGLCMHAHPVCASARLADTQAHGRGWVKHATAARSPLIMPAAPVALYAVLQLRRREPPRAVLVAAASDDLLHRRMRACVCACMRPCPHFVCMGACDAQHAASVPVLALPASRSQAGTTGGPRMHHRGHRVGIGDGDGGAAHCQSMRLPNRRHVLQFGQPSLTSRHEQKPGRPSSAASTASAGRRTSCDWLSAALSVDSTAGRSAADSDSGGAAIAGLWARAGRGCSRIQRSCRSCLAAAAACCKTPVFT
eukprot:365452-Chlamydomonas_euryale.AAC.8